MQIKEGYLETERFHTYYRIAGGEDVEKTPLLLIHGGPGSTHNYFESLDGMAAGGRAVISYDQIGCGNSYLEGCPELWTADTWLDELEALRCSLSLQKVHILGQSWGGMLALLYLLDRNPEGVVSVILSSSLSSASLWAREQHRMIRYLPDEDQRAIAQAEETGNYSDPAYLRANEHFMERHCAGKVTDDSPEYLRRPKKAGTESYVAAWGPNEYVPSGTLRNYEITGRLGEIRTPVLIVSGTDDLCTPLVAKTMADRIAGSRWELLEGCRHMCFVEASEKYQGILSAWMAEHE